MTRPQVLFDSRRSEGFQKKRTRPFLLFGAVTLGAVVLYLVVVFLTGLYQTENAIIYMGVILVVFGVILLVVGTSVLKDVKEFTRGVIIHSDALEINGVMHPFKEIDELDWTYSKDTAMLKWTEGENSRKYEFFKETTMEPETFLSLMSKKLRDRLIVDE